MTGPLYIANAEAAKKFILQYTRYVCDSSGVPESLETLRKLKKTQSATTTKFSSFFPPVSVEKLNIGPTKAIFYALYPS